MKNIIVREAAEPDGAFADIIRDEITHDTAFRKGCSSCINFDILQNKKYRNCLCTAMLFDKAAAVLNIELA